MRESFKDKIAFITGGSSGIGFAVASMLAKRGSHVWIIARGQERLASAIESIRASAVSPDQCFGTQVVDVSDYNQVDSALQVVKQQIGVPDFIINAAGVTRPGYIQDLDLQVFHEMINIDYFGTVHIVKAVLPDLLARGSGHIVNISSAAGFLGVFGYSAYSPAKFAVTGFSEVIRAELKPHGIRVSIVFPADTDTPQLAYENQYKPAETKAITTNANLLKPEQTALSILRGIERGKFIILPGFENKLAYHLNHLVRGLVAGFMDYKIATTQQRIKTDNGQRLGKQ